MQNQSSDMVKWVSLSIVAGAVIISGAIIYSGSKPSAGPALNNNNPTPQPGVPVTVSMDDDAVLGNANASVTLIEFSDYECPFCKRHFTDVYPQIKKDYIDTGKVKMVFRDFIAVPSHNPLATTQAEAAQCAKDQGGDSAYFAFHDQIFAKTTSNGNGMPVSELSNIARAVGLNVGTFDQCVSSRKFKAEVEKDQADGAAAGITGTPSFVVGKSSADGKVTGKIIVGAQPYSAFQAAIEEALK
ncbi:MAG TPA: DsbA family protein [Negativicutes bacterium]|nr:DsbA family protein [Negativicutes bacterium]